MSSIFDKYEANQQANDDLEKELVWCKSRIKSLNQIVESDRPEYLVDLDDQVKKLEAVNANQAARIQELNDIITGDRPDLYHDSLIRGSRVARMEECVSTLRTIVRFVDSDMKVSDSSKLKAIRESAEETIKRKLEQ